SAVNAAGLLLRYFNLPDYIILIGFRFHLSAAVPFLFIIKSLDEEFLKNIFLHTVFSHKTIFAFLLFIPLVIGAVSGYLFAGVELNDPRYFYEFGLSSIVDLPLYLIWNIPQLILLFLFLSKTGRSFYSSFFVLFFLFLYLFIPLELKTFNYLNPVAFIIFISALSLVFCKFNNVYFFVVYSFLIPWVIFLSFGSDSERIINILFAAKYISWEGFFTTGGKVGELIIPAFFFIVLATNIIFSIFVKKKESSLLKKSDNFVS
ncbi:MAG: hypothetical protein K8H86_07340, partial [Ignavibacteriaceae bacterium]|nr:hypothetical protein [Ignavibacteriaceae bacterium]